MALHTTIIKTLKKDRVGFVMDRTQSGQVWNPFILPMLIGTSIEVADAIKDNPGLAGRLAPGVATVAQVNVKLKWSFEPQTPQMDYIPEFDDTLESDDTPGFDDRHAQGSSDLQYFLEFDKSGILVGGEWGTFSKTQPTSQVPDFLFGFKQGSKPLD